MLFVSLGWLWFSCNTCFSHFTWKIIVCPVCLIRRLIQLFYQSHDILFFLSPKERCLYLTDTRIQQKTSLYLFSRWKNADTFTTNEVTPIKQVLVNFCQVKQVWITLTAGNYHSRMSQISPISIFKVNVDSCQNEIKILTLCTPLSSINSTSIVSHTQCF